MDSVVSGMKKVMWTNEISGVTFGEVKLRLEYLQSDMIKACSSIRLHVICHYKQIPK